MEINKKYIWIRIIMMLLIACTATITIVRNQRQEDNPAVTQYIQTVRSSKYIIHALGGDDGKCYINSIDCLEEEYADGHRLFEADVSFTSDGVLVLAHSGENNIWTRNDWELRLGQEYPFDRGDIPDEYDAERHLVPYDVFMDYKIQGSYRASSFAELLDYMESHEDMYVMVDAGYRSYEDTLAYYQEIVREADGRTELLDRLIAGGQTTEMVRAAREVYDFPIINLYYNSDDKREEIIGTPEKFVKYCSDNNILSFSVASEVYTEDVAEGLDSEGLISYVFTVNDRDEERRLREYGADVIGTDYLCNEEK